MKVAVAYYRDLVRWDAKSFIIKQWQWTEDILKPLGGVLERRAEPATNNDLPMLSIHFGGRISERPVKELKGQLFNAYAQDIVFSKIDARNGAITVIPNQYPIAAFTNEFPIYRIRDGVKALPAYLFLVFQTPTFLAQINALVSGASGRKRITPEWWESLTIPIPAISEQQSIIREYQTALQKAEKLQQEAEKQEQSINDYLLAELGIERREQKAQTGVFVVRYKNLERWDTGYFTKHDLFISNSKYPVSTMQDALEKMQSGMTPTTSKQQFWNGTIPWVSPKDFGDLQISDSQDHITDLALEQTKIKMIPEQSILVVFRSGILQHTLPVTKTTVPVCINQDLKALIPKKHVLPDYLLQYLHAVQGLVLNRIVKYGPTVQSIITAEFLKMPIPIPSPGDQIKLLRKVEELTARAQKAHSEAAAKREEAKILIEKRILGIV